MGAHITVWGEPDAILPLSPAGLTGVWAEENTRASLSTPSAAASSPRS